MLQSGDRLLVATHNAGKLEEIRQLFLPMDISVVGAAALGLPEPEETETTFEGNARLKAMAAAAASGLLALADDSGLCVDGLGGCPGVFTADWATTYTGRDFSVGMKRVHHAVIDRHVAVPWRAQFKCTFALASPEGICVIVEGLMPGRLIWPPRGCLGHGFDPMFVPDGFAQTCGEMDRWEKNLVSHRARAFQELVARCFT